MDTGSWLLKNQDTPDSGIQAAHPSFLRRPPRRSLAGQSAYRNQDWTNPNRFSDPLHRSSPSAHSLGSSLASRPNKAYTWCLESDTPMWMRRAAAARPKTVLNDRHHSLFASAVDKAAAVAPEDDSRRKRRNGMFLTWERVRQQSNARAAYRQSNTLDVGTAAKISGRLSPHVLATRGSTQLSVGQSMSMYGGGGHLSAQRSSPRGNQRASISPNSLAVTHSAIPNATHRRSLSPLNLGSHLSTSPCGSRRSSPSPHLLSSQVSGSPCSSQRSSPNRSPQSTMARLSPGLMRRSNSPAGVSPTQLLNAISLGGTSPSLRSSQSSVMSQSSRSSFLSQSSRSSFVSQSFRSSFVSQWVNNSAGSPAFKLSPCSTRSSQTSSGHDDVSYGSETDDDFFYVSCQQLTQGLAELAVSSSRDPFPAPAHVQGPSFIPVADGACYMGEDDDDFDGCSDDALSDDVFLDNPQVPAMTRSADGQLSQEATSTMCPDGEESSRDAMDKDEEGSGSSKEQVAVESLSRNSLQSKLRRTWQNRRHKAAAMENNTEAGLTHPDTDQTLPPCQAGELDSPHHQNELQSTSGEEDDIGASQTKPCFYYVISPTDDVSMPDVIAVRRSSVELIRWQNSLRRRRRRQAKRHDLGRNRKKEPKQSATV